jgi:hypothetical protein
MLKIKDEDGKVIGTLKDEDTEPSMKCVKCEGTGWNFKDRVPPFPECICKKTKGK